MNLKRKFRTIKRTWKNFENLPNLLQIWVKLKFILKPLLIILGLITTTVPVYFEQESLLRVYKGITIPSGPVSINLNFSDPTNIHVNFPYKIENDGFHDLHNILLKISLKLRYFHKDTEEERLQTILSAYSNEGYAKVGNIYQDIYNKEYLDFQWASISKFLLEFDENKQVIVLLDIEVSFLLSGVEKDWILLANNSLTPSSGDISARASISSKPSFNYLFLTILILTVILPGWLMIKKKKKPKRVNITKIKKKKESEIMNIRRGFLKVIAYSTFVILWDVFLFINQAQANILSPVYLIQFTVAIWTSFLLLILFDWLSLLPVIRHRKYRKYSSIEGTRSLFSSIIAIIILFVWSSVSIVSYEIDVNTLVIRDTFQTYIPLMILFGINVGIKFVDKLSYNFYKKDFIRFYIYEEKIKKFESE